MKRITSFALALIMALTATFALGFSSYAATSKNITGKLNYDYAVKVLQLVNEERASRGISKLKLTKDLTKAAMIRSAELTETGLSHTRPNGQDCFSMFTWQNAAGENVAYGQITPESVVNDWMNSETHRKNILDTRYKTIGIGCFEYGGTYYWTQNFNGGETTTSYNPSGVVSATVQISFVSGVKSSFVGDTTESSSSAVSNTVTLKKPKATKIVSLTKKPKSFTVKWAKKSGITGYQIRYATKKDMSNAKKVKITKKTTVSKTIKKLKGNKRYYVQVRTYKNYKVNGKTKAVYSSWSTKKSVVTKR